MTTSFVIILAGIYGAIIGSFLNVVALRDTRRRTIVTGRSQCPHCKHTLAWYELIPILSFFLQGGMCRKCKKPLSWRYPLVELACAFLTAGVVWYGYYQVGSSFLTVCLLLSAWLLFVVSLIDLSSMEIPVEYVVAAGIIGAIGEYGSHTASLTTLLFGMVVGGAVIAIISYGWKLLFKEQGMGDGDIWLAAALGAIVGYPQILLVIGVGSILGALVGVAAMAGKRVTMNSQVPFGPFLFLGAILVVASGQFLLSWYIL